MRVQRSVSSSAPTQVANAPIAKTALQGPKADQYAKAAVQREQREQRAEVKQSIADMAQVAIAAVAATREIKTTLRAEIGGLVVTNGQKLTELRVIAADFKAQDGNVNMFQAMASRIAGNMGGKDWVAILEYDVERSAREVTSLESRLHHWTSSIVTVEAEVHDLEQHAAVLATPPPVASNIAALRAHATAVGSLAGLEANLERQVGLLTALRDAGAELSDSLTTYIGTLQGLLDKARANVASSLEMMKLFIEFMVTGNPGQAAKSYLRKQLSNKVQKALYEAGVSPAAFADHLLKDANADVATALRPKLVEAFAAAMPAAFSGNLGL